LSFLGEERKGKREDPITGGVKKKEIAADQAKKKEKNREKGGEIAQRVVG